MAKTKTKKLNPKRTPAAPSSSASTAGHTPPPNKSLKKKSKKTKKPDIAAHYDDTPSPAGAAAGASDPDMSLDSGTEVAAPAPAPDSVADSAVTLDPASVETAAALVRARAAARGVEAALLRNGEERVEVDAGFIFFCSESTKLECFSNRVFGLPHGRIDLVRRIRPRASLFLYDFSVKLMYGVYRATSAGGLNLVPGAFQGRFPAQVQFDILEDCIPVHERDFRSAIEENYELGSRFRPDLNSKQVQKLRALFHPVPLSAIAGASASASSSAPSQAPAPAPVSVPVRTFAPQQPEQRRGVYHNLPDNPSRSGYPVCAPPAIDARHGLPYDPPAFDARQGLPYDPRYGPPAVAPRYGPPAVDPRYGPPAVDPWYDMQYRPPAVDNRHLQSLQHGPSAFDARHALQHGPPALDDPYGLQHGPPAFDGLYGLQHGPPVDPRRGLQHGPPIDPRRGLQHGPPVDSQHRPQFGPPPPDVYGPDAYYSHEPPPPECQHTPSTKAYPSDPYSLETHHDPYRQADERDYHAPSHGQPEHYQEPSGGVSSGPPPPIAPGRDYRSLTGQGAPQTSGGDPAYYADRASPQYGHQAGTYEDLNCPYTAPVSSRYAFAGAAPAYR